MRQLADDVWLLHGRPRYAMNVYVIGDVLIDAATRRAGRRILRQLEHRKITAHALTAPPRPWNAHWESADRV